MTIYAYECAAEALVDEVKKLKDLPDSIKKALLVLDAASIVDQAMCSDNHEDIDIDDIRNAVEAVDIGLKDLRGREYDLAITRWLFDNVIQKHYPIEEYPLVTYENCLNWQFAKMAGVIA